MLRVLVALARATGVLAEALGALVREAAALPLGQVQERLGDSLTEAQERQALRLLLAPVLRGA